MEAPPTHSKGQEHAGNNMRFKSSILPLKSESHKHHIPLECPERPHKPAAECCKKGRIPPARGNRRLHQHACQKDAFELEGLLPLSRGVVVLCIDLCWLKSSSLKEQDHSLECAWSLCLG
mmetsp:Transcript_2964/g.18630  ORF Transcript_2964/g.18630 Transcript_2964/m.18630 type:complete len:120 (-) Transcript_2964:1249-1608(-)